MNPELPSTPREELEAKLSALLLGELEPSEAAALRETIARDPALARLHDELRQTIALVRAASAQSEEPMPGVTGLPKMSEGKRSQLLERLRANAAVTSGDAADRRSGSSDSESQAATGEGAQVIPVRFPEASDALPLPRRRTNSWLALAAALVALLAAAAFFLDGRVRSRVGRTDIAAISGPTASRGESGGRQWVFMAGNEGQGTLAPQPVVVTNQRVDSWSAGTLEADAVRRSSAQTKALAQATREADQPLSFTLKDGVAPQPGTLRGVAEVARPSANQSVAFFRNTTSPGQNGQPAPAMQPELARRYGLAPAGATGNGRVAEAIQPANRPSDRGRITDLYAKADATPSYANGQQPAGPESMFNTITAPNTSTTQGLGERGEAPKRNVLAGFFDAIPVETANASPAEPGSQSPPAPADAASPSKDQSRFAYFGASPPSGLAATTAAVSEKVGELEARQVVPALQSPTTAPDHAKLAGVVALTGSDVDGDTFNFGYRLEAKPAGAPVDLPAPSASAAGAAGGPGPQGSENAPRLDDLALTIAGPGTAMELGRRNSEQEALAQLPAGGGTGGGGSGAGGRFRGGASAVAEAAPSAGQRGLTRLGEEPVTKERVEILSRLDSTRDLAENEKRKPEVNRALVMDTEDEKRAAPSAAGSAQDFAARELASSLALGKRATAAPKDARDKLSLGDEPALGARFQASKPTAEGSLMKRAGGRAEAIVAGTKVEAGDRMSDKSDDKPVAPPPVAVPVPQPEVVTADNAFSTFSLNVADVSYKLAAATLEKGALPEPGSIRSEEFVNAFRYRDPEPTPGAPFSLAWERAQYPFAHHRDVVRLSLRTAARGRETGRPLNLVLVLDSSGSMERADRVRIIREALRILAGQLRAEDRISVVSFARTARLWVDALPGNRASELVERVGQITPEGGTNLEDALRVAYEAALKHFLPDGVNRVILLTDGAANLGDVTPESLQRNVESYRQRGVALDCFGIGWEGLNDDLLETLSRHGDGRYGFLNTPEEAATGFVDQLAGALQVAASDVKVQIEWNPRRVSAWRQIGYARHQLKKEQFRDNTVDAAELGAAESGTALYVIESLPQGDGPLGTVRVRSKDPATGTYREHEWALPYTGPSSVLEQASPALRLATVAAAFSESLAGSPFAAEVSSDRLLGLLQGVPAAFEPDPRAGRLEWMIRQTKSIRGN